MPRILGLIFAWVLAAGCGGKLDESVGSAGGQGGTSHVPPHYGGYCFGKGTLIATATGSVAIEDLHVGDQVQGFDRVTGTIVERTVTDVYVYPSRRVGLLQTALGPLRVTPEHPIYDLETDTFVAAASLTKPFTALELTSNWSIAPTTREAFLLLDDVETVYNLTVADVHTYFANGLLVHNKQPPCGSPGIPLCRCGIGGSCGGGGSAGVGGGSGAAGANTGGATAGAGGNGGAAGGSGGAAGGSGSAAGGDGAGGATGEGGAEATRIDGGAGPGGGGGIDGD